MLEIGDAVLADGSVGIVSNVTETDCTLAMSTGLSKDFNYEDCTFILSYKDILKMYEDAICARAK